MASFADRPSSGTSQGRDLIVPRLLKSSWGSARDPGGSSKGMVHSGLAFQTPTRYLGWAVVDVRQRGGVRRAAWLMGIIASALAATQCNAVVDTNIEQCQTTDDCVSKGPAFANAICTAEKICSLAGGDCDTNQECLDRFDGKPAICRRPDRTCVALTTPDCDLVFPAAALAEDSTLVLGFMAPLRGEFASNGLPPWEGVQLAVNELDKFGSGLPLPNGARRRVAFVACHDLDDPLRVARHLAENVRVPAIIGPAFSGITLDVATKVTIPAGTLLMSPSATSTAITDLQDQGLVWRTAPSDAIQAIPLSGLAADLEDRIRASLGMDASEKIRLAVTVKGDAYGLGLANAVLGQLQFNGQAALSAQNAPFFRRSDYPDPSDQPSYDFTGLVADLVAFTPHVVLALGTTESVTKILKGIEDSWPGANRPVYVLGDGGRDTELLPLVAASPSLADRIVGTVPGRTTTQFAQFASSFKGFHQNKTPGSYADTAYDAAYLLAYASVAVGKIQLTGSDFNAGLKKMVGGVKVPAGPDGINTALNSLTAKNNIDYDGVSGPLDFDVSTGEAPADIVVWCTGIDAGNQPTFIDSGQYFDALQNSLVGTRSACEGLIGTSSGSGGTGGSSGTGGTGGG